MLFGKNVNTEIVLAIIGLKESDVERFRDCGMDEDGILVYTRTGGGNREYYPNEKLTTNPYYRYDEDDDFDCTYASYYFNFPAEINQDCINLLNVQEKGISGKLIQWVLKTLDREATKEDIYHDLWNQQNSLVMQSKRTNIVESNGHTITPLDDYSLDTYLALMEKNNGEQLSYDVKPLKIQIEKDEKHWMKFEYVSKNNGWEVDMDMWNHWKEMFAEKYPKSIETIEKSLK